MHPSSKTWSPLNLRAWGLIFTIVTLGPVYPAPTAQALASEFWPLVECADAAVWGVVESIETGDRDRLVTIAVHGRADLAGSGGSGRLLLLERCGRYPDRTSLHPGDTGLLLYRFPEDDSGEWPHPDGWLVAHGFLPAPNDAGDHGLVTELVQRDFADEPARPHTALRLLESDSAACRKLGLEWLRRSEYELDGQQRRLLGDTFRDELDSENLYLFLDLFLVREWNLAGSGISTIVLTHEHPALNRHALFYRQRHRDADDEARLLMAYPNADDATKIRLLHAYAALQLEESAPWWEDALTSPERTLREAAVHELGHANVPDAVSILEQLIDSDDVRLATLALRSLVSRADSEALAALRRHLDRLPDGQERAHVRRMMKHPFRLGRVNVRLDRDE